MSASSPFGDPTTTVPVELRTDEFLLRPIAADDAEADFAAVVETRDWLRLWEQSTWPDDDFTVEANRADLVGLEERHAQHKAFTYTVVDPHGTDALGCVYLFPTDAKFLARSTVTPVAGESWADVELVAYFWARLSRMETGLDARLLAELRRWLAEDWHLDHVVFVTNEQFTQQVALLDATDLALHFTLVEPEKPGTYLVYG